MMVSKDNPQLESSVAAVQREKPMRLENFCRDMSLVGVALIMVGGMGGHILKEPQTGEKTEKGG